MTKTFKTKTLSPLTALAVMIFAAFFMPSNAHAVCTSPAGDKADIIYNADDHVLQYCDDTNWIIAGQGSFPNGSPNFRKVFITSASYDGAIGGMGAADRRCNELADTASLGGYFRAWLSTSASEDPQSLFTQSTIPYGTTNGIKIANNWTDLTDGVLLNAIIRDETGAVVAGSTKVWTDTLPAGTFNNSSDCTDWSTTGGSAEYGFAGQLGIKWSDANTTDACTNTYRMYCVEQDPYTLPSTTKTVFVTSSTYNGDLVTAATGLGFGGSDGVAAADYICQDHADNASTPLTGTFKAWISHSSSTDPNSNFTNPTDPYVLLDGVKVADNWTDLTDGTLDASIMVDEDGSIVTGTDLVWTDVVIGGGNNNSSDCTNWTSAGTIGEYGMVGQLGVRWTDNTNMSCSNTNRLYCFEQ